ncbi:uncharacterized protein PHLOEM PROTEIN 2-LIKE A4-like [Typha angustifolia]|uniref:uncharacterized protein PHLOEM PROTEIN 2-LIKE A4-like n=1 Tax=Typha angustifolia TaxID=59011 RepID=UPI003C2DD3E8
MANEGSNLQTMSAQGGDHVASGSAPVRKDFMLYPKYSIAWGDTPQYWTWIWIKSDSKNTLVEVPRLVQVWWLDVAGNLDMSDLSKGTKYSVVFKVMKKKPSEGWAIPVNFTLTLPDGSSSLHKASLKGEPVDTWFDLYAGDFVAPGPGLLKFSMRETSDTNRKTGLIIKGVQIKPT